MKKYILIITTVICILGAASCSDDYTVLGLVPANGQFAAVFNPKQVAGEAGITITNDNKLQFPTTFTESADSCVLKDIENVNKFLTGSGIDLDSMAVYVPNYDDRPVYVLKLKDKNQFEKLISERGYEFIRGQMGVKIYCNDDNPGIAVATRGKIALIIEIEDPDDVWCYFYKPYEYPMSHTGHSGFIIMGNPVDDVSLPADVSRALTAEHPECLDILLFAKAIAGLISVT